MIAIQQTLQTIADYYSANRQVGHTTAMIKGAANVKPKPLVLVHSHDFRPVKDAVHVSVFNIHALTGRRQPLVIDNHCLALLFEGAAMHMQSLQDKVNEEHAALLRSRDIAQLATMARTRITEDMKALEHLLEATQEKLKRAKKKRKNR